MLGARHCYHSTTHNVYWILFKFDTAIGLNRIKDFCKYRPTDVLSSGCSCSIAHNISWILFIFATSIGLIREWTIFIMGSLFCLFHRAYNLFLELGWPRVPFIFNFEFGSWLPYVYIYIYICIYIYILGCCPCSFDGSPCVSVLRANSRSHSLTSISTHSDYVFLGLPRLLLLGIGKSVTVWYRTGHAIHVFNILATDLMPSFWKSEYDDVSSWSLVTGVTHFAAHLAWEVPAGVDTQQSSVLSLGHESSGSNDTITATTNGSTAYHLSSRKCPPHQHGAIDNHFSYCSANNGSSIALTTRADIVWGNNPSPMIPLHPLWTHSLHCELWMELCQTAQGLDFFRTSIPSLEIRNFFCFLLKWSPLISIPAFHALSLESDLHHVISIKNLPWHAITELMRKGSQHQDEEQCVQDRTLMHTRLHAKLLEVLTIDPHMTPGIGVHTLDDTHSPFIDTEAPQDLPWHPVKGFLKVNKRKVGQCLSGDVFLLQLASNKGGVSGTSTKHKAELRFVIV